MRKKEELREIIEKEREKLDQLTLGGNLAAAYHQSLIMDRLLEEYLSRQPEKYGRSS